MIWLGVAIFLTICGLFTVAAGMQFRSFEEQLNSQLGVSGEAAK